jgi:DNA polymerase-3 subunit delta
MPIQKLKNEIRNNKTAPFYYFYGAEKYLLNKAVTGLKKHLITKGMGDFNLDKFSLMEKSMQDILEAAYMLPMMADKRLIIVRDAERLKESDHDKFLNYAQKPVDTTCIIFISNKDKADMRLKFFGQFKKNGQIIQFKPLYENKLPYFIKDEVRDLGKTITGDAVNRLIQLVGNNLFELDAELQKISISIGDRKSITLKDVEEYSSDVRRSTVFELADSLGNKNLKSSLKMLKKMLEQGEYPTIILGAVIRHFNNLFQIRERLDKKEEKAEIARAVKIHPFFLNNYISQAKKIPKKDLEKVIDDILSADIALKSRKLPNRTILEKLFFDLCLQ